MYTPPNEPIYIRWQILLASYKQFSNIISDVKTWNSTFGINRDIAPSKRAPDSSFRQIYEITTTYDYLNPASIITKLASIWYIGL